MRLFNPLSLSLSSNLPTGTTDAIAYAAYAVTRTAAGGIPSVQVRERKRRGREREREKERAKEKTEAEASLRAFPFFSDRRKRRGEEETVSAGDGHVSRESSGTSASKKGPTVASPIISFTLAANRIPSLPSLSSF